MVLLAVSLFTSARQKTTMPYRDASFPVEQRVSDLLSRMTLQEKIGQLRCMLAWNYYDIIGRKKVVPSESFKKAIQAGALSVMTSYNSLDAVPSTMDDYYLQGVLRKEWGFRGFTVSDLYSIDGIWSTHHVAHDLTEAAADALNAGVDVDLGGRSYARLQEALDRGLTTEAAIDTACARVLRMKFEMGLFEHPYVDPDKAAKEVRSEENKAVALHAARKLITLLKNDGVLPLSKDMKVALVGPNADNVYNMLGDYTAPQADGNVKTVLDGMRQYLPDSRIKYVKGCAIRDTTTNSMAAAVEAARQSDVVVACVGGSSARDFKTSYKETGAAETGNGTVSDMESGEGYDRATLGLLGLQDRLLRALKRTGKPLVVVYIEGRPLLKNWAAEHADALLTAYYPGQEGGRAIADVLFGAYNPAGRLPVSVPQAVGQLPVYYNKKAVPQNYVEMTAKPLYAFGYGLSYTTFRYSNLSIVRKDATHFSVAFDVTNTGDRDGDEVPQLYLRDEVASVAQPVMQLRAFDRKLIKAGETRHFSFDLGPEELCIVNRDMKEVVEPGDFTVMVGPSSDNIRLKDTLKVQ